MKESLKDRWMYIYQILGVDYFLEKLKNDFMNHQSGNSMIINTKHKIPLLYHLDNPYEFIKPFSMTFSFPKCWFPYSRDYSNIVDRENMKNAMSMYQDDWYDSFAYHFNQLVAIKKSQRSRTNEMASKNYSKDDQRIDTETIKIDDSKKIQHKYTDFISKNERYKKTIVMNHPLYSLIEDGKGITSLPNYDKSEECHTFEYEASHIGHSNSDNRSNAWSR